MSLRDRITQELVQATKGGDALKRDALRMVQAALKNQEIELRRPVTDPEILGVLNKLAKQRLESIEQFRLGGRNDLVDKEMRELEIVKSFLPTPLSAAELDALIDKVIAETGAQGPQDLGKVMKPVLSAAAGRADGGQVSARVKERLARH